MAATPPRPASPVSCPIVMPQSGHTLQISPNLEALLQHDELTRRSTGSPTNPHPTATSTAYPVSLPPPPPRKAKDPRKQQEPFPTIRSKEAQRRRGAGFSADFWPDALSAASPPDSAPAQPMSACSDSRPVTPNPYLNPAPILRPINTHLDTADTPRPSAKTLPPEPSDSPSSSQPVPDTRARSSPDISQRPSRKKVEKILWMGRDSLSLFSGSVSSPRRHDSEHRNNRAESGASDAVQDMLIRQAPHVVSRPSSRFGETDTATGVSSSRPGTPYLQLLQDRSETVSTHSLSISSEANDPTIFAHRPHPSRLLPRLSLPSNSMSRHPSPRPQLTGSVTHDDPSFIDFVSPSTSDDSNLCHTRAASPSRHHLQPINTHPSSLYSMSRHNISSSSLASMKFALPPSPSLSMRQSSPTSFHRSDRSSSSSTLPSMVFAPPSPCSISIPPTRLQPFSGPPSPYSPLEFAPPPGPLQEAVDNLSPPTTPEITCDRTKKFKPKKRSKSSSPYPGHHSVASLPPTTNQLGASERADRIRRNRKLARVFGRTPGKEEPATDADEPRSSKKLYTPSLAALLSKQKNHRHAVSVSVSLKAAGMKTEPSTPWQTDGSWSPGGRRHSTPLTPGTFTLYVDDDQTKGLICPRNAMDGSEVASTKSFIDLSEEVRDDDVSALSCFSFHHHTRRRIHQTNSTPSFVESLDLEAQAELDKRRKREKLARLHRFLGSSVPPEAVIGNVYGPPLPPPAVPEDSPREFRFRRSKHTMSDGFDRSREELDEKEKALNVRRAQKMEKVFGAQPPQTLFHTRPSRPAVPASQPTSPTHSGANPFVLTLDIPSLSRNPNQSAYLGKTLHRQGPSDSLRCLLPRNEDTPQSSPSSFAQSFTDSFTGPSSGFQEMLAQSTVYLNYQHSLNSLVDIIDRDDRKSLVELHRFLHGEADRSEGEEEEATVNAHHGLVSSSSKSERRHSLPSNASMTSLSSEFSVSPETLRFQSRRRKAAKLTNFFGVDYRELIQDILESIEKGVEEEHMQGTLQPQEVEVLMHRVRSLRSLNDPFQG